MKKLIFTLLLFFIISCNKSENEVAEGYLYFKLVNFIPSNGLTASEILKIEQTLTTYKEENQNPRDIVFYNYLNQLKKNKILGLPYINLKIGENEIKTIFLSKKEYEKIKPYTLTSLNKNKKKLLINLKEKKLSKNLYFSDKIISLKLEKGQTYFNK
jgi:hypothetical protein